MPDKTDNIRSAGIFRIWDCAGGKGFVHAQSDSDEIDTYRPAASIPENAGELFLRSYREG